MSSILQPSRSLAKEDAVQRNGYRIYERAIKLTKKGYQVNEIVYAKKPILSRGL